MIMVNIALVWVIFVQAFPIFCSYICTVIKNDKIMKTMKKISIALFMLMTLQVFSADISIKTKDDNAVEIRVKTISENENIKIYDEKGDILFFEKIDSRNYLKVFTLNTLSNGQYYVEYENDSEISTAIVNKQDNGIVVTSNFKEITFKPIIKQDKNYINLGFTNPKRENIDIIINDVYGFKFVDIQNLNELFIKKTFDTGRLPEGDYTIQVKTSTNKFSKTITVK
jgi:hypothetical protein